MTKAVEITDHSLLRYLERVKGVDVDKARAEIASIVRTIPAGCERLSAGGVTYIFKGNRLVTITPGASPQSARHKTRKHMGKPVQKFQGAVR